jgi:hypothetical protein
VKTRQEIQGFEFLVCVDGRETWTRLQGSGGNIGAGTLYAVRDKRRSSLAVRSICDVFLQRARRELRNTGVVRTWTDHDDPSRRIAAVRADAVLDCRPIVVRVPA